MFGEVEPGSFARSGDRLFQSREVAPFRPPRVKEAMMATIE
jgi:hypothetical protein